MVISGTVHSRSTHPVETDIAFDGEPMKGVIQETEVVIVMNAPEHGSLTLRFRRAADVAESAALTRDARVSIVIDAVPAEPAPAEEQPIIA